MEMFASLRARSYVAAELGIVVLEKGLGGEGRALCVADAGILRRCRMNRMNWLSPRGPEQPKVADASAKLTLGVSPVVAELTFSGSPRNWFARLFRRETLAEVVRVTHARVHVSIQEDDAGDMYAYFGLLNMGKKPLRVDQIVLEACTVNGNDIKVPQPTISPPSEPVEGRSIEDIYISIALGAPQIRQFIRVVQPSANRRSSPRVEVAFRVAVHLRRGSEMDVMRFTAASYQPALLITCPSAPQID